ncbi:MAG: hemerythrin family protein [Candidatus Goldiibacteriota bacterium]|jgi:hemerythrin
MYLEWTPDLSVGIGEIDVQHRKMVRKLNDIAGAVEADKGMEEIEEAIKYFEVYSDEHFKTEEGYMTLYMYPEYADHKKNHDKILADMAEVRENFSGGRSDKKDVYAASKKVADWFLIHMKTTDSRMAIFLRGKVK